MVKETPDSVPQIESAAQITLIVSKGPTNDEDAEMIEVPIASLDTTKEIDISQSRENTLKASGFSINSIDYSGSMEFAGSSKTKEFPDGSTRSLDDLLYHPDGTPRPVSISITHDTNGETDTYQTVLVTSDSYESSEGEQTTTGYDWAAMDYTGDQA